MSQPDNAFLDARSTPIWQKMSAPKVTDLIKKGAEDEKPEELTPEVVGQPGSAQELPVAPVPESETPKTEAQPDLSKKSIAELIAMIPAEQLPGELTTLSTAPQIPIRAFVAKHLSTPVEILTNLAFDQAEVVRMAVAANPNITDEAVDQLMNDPNTKVKIALGSNPNVREDVRQRLRQSSIKQFEDNKEVSTALALSDTMKNTPSGKQEPEEMQGYKGVIPAKERVIPTEETPAEKIQGQKAIKNVVEDPLNRGKQIKKQIEKENELQHAGPVAPPIPENKELQTDLAAANLSQEERDKINRKYDKKLNALENTEKQLMEQWKVPANVDPRAKQYFIKNMQRKQRLDEITKQKETLTQQQQEELFRAGEEKKQKEMALWNTVQKDEQQWMQGEYGDPEQLKDIAGTIAGWAKKLVRKFLPIGAEGKLPVTRDFVITEFPEIEGLSEGISEKDLVAQDREKKRKRNETVEERAENRQRGAEKAQETKELKEQNTMDEYMKKYISQIDPKDLPPELAEINKRINEVVGLDHPENMTDIQKQEAIEKKLSFMGFPEYNEKARESQKQYDKTVQRAYKLIESLAEGNPGGASRTLARAYQIVNSNSKTKLGDLVKLLTYYRGMEMGVEKSMPGSTGETYTHRAPGRLGWYGERLTRADERAKKNHFENLTPSGDKQKLMYQKFPEIGPSFTPGGPIVEDRQWMSDRGIGTLAELRRAAEQTLDWGIRNKANEILKKHKIENLFPEEAQYKGEELKRTVTQRLQDDVNKIIESISLPNRKERQLAEEKMVADPEVSAFVKQLVQNPKDYPSISPEVIDQLKGAYIRAGKALTGTPEGQSRLQQLLKAPKKSPLGLQQMLREYKKNKDIDAYKQQEAAPQTEDESKKKELEERTLNFKKNQDEQAASDARDKEKDDKRNEERNEERKKNKTKGAFKLSLKKYAESNAVLTDEGRAVLRRGNKGPLLFVLQAIDSFGVPADRAVFEQYGPDKAVAFDTAIKNGFITEAVLPNGSEDTFATSLNLKKKGDTNGPGGDDWSYDYTSGPTDTAGTPAQRNKRWQFHNKPKTNLSNPADGEQGNLISCGPGSTTPVNNFEYASWTQMKPVKVADNDQFNSYQYELADGKFVYYSIFKKRYAKLCAGDVVVQFGKDTNIQTFRRRFGSVRKAYDNIQEVLLPAFAVILPGAGTPNDSLAEGPTGAPGTGVYGPRRGPYDQLPLAGNRDGFDAQNPKRQNTDRNAVPYMDTPDSENVMGATGSLKLGISNEELKKHRLDPETFAADIQKSVREFADDWYAGNQQHDNKVEQLKEDAPITGNASSLRIGKADKLPGGLGDKMPDSKVDPKQLNLGIKVEKEHTPDPKIEKEIAKDHLTEIPDYYTRLNHMEEDAKPKLDLKKKADIGQTPEDQAAGVNQPNHQEPANEKELLVKRRPVPKYRDRSENLESGLQRSDTIGLN